MTKITNLRDKVIVHTIIMDFFYIFWSAIEGATTNIILSKKLDETGGKCLKLNEI